MSWRVWGTSIIKRVAICTGFVLVSCAGSHSAQLQGTGKQNVASEETASVGKASRTKEEGPRDQAPGEILVKFREGTDRKTIEAIQETLHLKTLRVYPKTDLYLMKIEEGLSVEETVGRLKALPEVSHAEPNFKVRIQAE